MIGLHILVASADDRSAQALSQALRAAGHRVEVASDPDMAVRLAGSPLDALVVDLRLPGLAPIAALRALFPSAAIPPEPLEAVERRQIALALEYTGGNKRRAAHLLGIARSTLIQKVRRYQLPSARP